MSSRPSAWPWQLLSTTVLVRRKRWRCSRTAPHDDRRPAPEPGRWRSKLRTTANGHRRLLYRERGQASSRSLGRRGVTAACGTPQGELLHSRWCRWLVATPRTTLLSAALAMKKDEEEEERRKKEEELRADEKKLEARERKRAKALKGWDEEALWQLNRRVQVGSTLSSAEYAAWYYWDGGVSSSSSASGLKKKKKKRRRRRRSSHVSRRLPGCSPSCSTCSPCT